jgi:RNA polymerase sigma-70 factor, ECF subfamily
VESDEQLVARILAGRVDAFEAIVERHKDVVFRVAARVVGRDDAEDVAQDAFLRAFHRLRQFRGEASFRSWLLQITHHTALDHLARRLRLPAAQDEPPAEVPEPQERRTPAEELESAERRARLEMKIAAMRPAHRIVLVLRDIEGLSYDEIAAVTDMPIGSVKGRLHRARGELIELLRANTYDWELPG